MSVGRIEGEDRLVVEVPNNPNNRDRLNRLSADLQTAFEVHPGNIRIEPRGLVNDQLELVAQIVTMQTHKDAVLTLVDQIMGQQG